MIEYCANWRSILFIVSLLIQLTESIKCFYCASPGTKIAPQLWLHSESCVKRRYTTCKSPDQACVVVKVMHSRLNFTVAGCSEDQLEGCDQFVQLSPHGPTALHMCQCRADRCNSDFHLDFGASLGRIRNNKTKDMGKLPMLKKVHPINASSSKSERGMPCTDERCNANFKSSSSATAITLNNQLLFVFFTFIVQRLIL